MKKVLQILLSLAAVCLLSVLIVTVLAYAGSPLAPVYSFLQSIGCIQLSADLESLLTVLSEKGYLSFQLYISFILLLIVACMVKMNTLYPYLTAFLRYIYTGLKSVWNDIKSWQVLVVLFIPFATSIYFGWIMPVSYDEALTFVDFTNKPILYCLTSYPYPNNHVLHSIITHITVHIPFFDLLFCLRISSIIVSILTWAITYSFVKRYYGEKTALFVTAISSMLFMTIYYSYMSRGYGLLVLFFVIALYATFNIIKRGNWSKDWAVFTLSSILGLYAVPSFLYPYLTLNLVIFIYNYKNIKKQVIFNLLAGLFTLLLYMPIILNEGFSALTVTPLPRDIVVKYLPTFFPATLYDIFRMSLFITSPFIAGAFLVAIFRKDKFTLILWAVFAIVPVILLVIQSVVPFPRTFVYYGVTLIFLIAISIHPYIEKISKNLLFGFLVLIQVAFFFNFKWKIYEYETFNIDYQEINDILTESGKKIYILSALNTDTNMFEMIRKGYDMSNVRYEKTFRGYEYIKIVDADTIKGDYDYIFIDTDKDETKHRKAVYTNEWFTVYGRE